MTYLSRPVMPDLASFGPKYPHILTGTPDQASAYRFLLGSLGRPAWDSAAAALQRQLTDSVIAAAVRRMPAPYQALVGQELVATLRGRRDNLPKAVQRMFSSIRGEADVHATRGSDFVSAEWATPDSLTLHVGTDTQRYSAKETKELTLYLLGGVDTVTVSGIDATGPTLRIVPEKAHLIVADSVRAAPGRCVW